jgi:CheY-like chemotaxis protein
VSGIPSGHAEALTIARAGHVDVVVIDADPTDVDPAELVAGVVLVSAAPVIALSATALPESAAAGALFAAGAQMVLHKPSGRLPLDLADGFGQAVAAASRRVAIP